MLERRCRSRRLWPFVGLLGLDMHLNIERPVLGRKPWPFEDRLVVQSNAST
jgi:hypothetical protein